MIELPDKFTLTDMDKLRNRTEIHFTPEQFNHYKTLLKPEEVVYKIYKNKPCLYFCGKPVFI